MKPIPGNAQPKEIGRSHSDQQGRKSNNNNKNQVPKLTHAKR